MAVLSLLRHAKAAHPLVGQQDFDRSLTERGRNDAAWVGNILATLAPDLAFVSPARRTRETWEIAGRGIAPAPDLMLEENLYLCNPPQLIARLRQIPANTSSVIVVGHNPCMQEVALWLGRRSKGPALAGVREKFPAAALAIFDLPDSTWGQLAPEQAVLRRFVTPHMID